ncbi:hypothetical protein AVEN_109576-1 [Araneus ventricosus]|uniref:Uncharacterized protein n=1 Tax=Araneus ventricosus TaxID=182803 RepID=A0A4Y2V175_ARAVE|nr:hypothetical protein AVEN_109576-1 [Araneus ventricosus]
MINTYENCKANEDSNLRSNLQSSANVLVTFNPFCEELWCARVQKEMDPLMTSSFELKIARQDEAADVKTDINPKRPCLGCMVDVVSNPTSACRVSSRSSY